jgi:FKBP-type peptidyl-prolyl cis-trans isomerase FkpA
MKAFPFVLLGLALLSSACKGNDVSVVVPTAPTLNVAFSATDLRAGAGAAATSGRLAQVRYAGWIYSPNAADNKGSQFDAGTFTFTVGTGVIPGFSQGVTGMQIGGIRRIVIPPNLGYGNNPPSNSGIRPNETLLFEVELLAVQ